ncbi:glycosyltransferase family 2 protein [Pseudovibrio sp. POLY-S9]|uniref:glycosyltransferase family 2 protein n=1 Tax=Pseudovibrio sp. POLY-S9 TaxID=1576596 RepID=UPI000B1CA2D8|nr:glycosyltransferase family 2 protein [Pseudovibrio sp. POLY-S9]
MRPSKHSNKSRQTGYPLICILRDEADILPAFLHHYRSIGVTCFYIVDTGSSDGSREFLLQQNDVQLFEKNGGYPQANAGIDWVNEIGSKYCKDKWTTVVDADEFLQPPQLSIHGTTDALQSELAFALYTPLIDFFCDDLTSAPKCAVDLDELITNTPNYVPFSKFHTERTQAFPFFELRSSARADMSGRRNYLVRSYKIPLVYWQADFQYLRSTHLCTPVPLGDTCGHLLHFKYRSGFEKRLLKELENPDRMNADVYRISKAIIRNQKLLHQNTVVLRNKDAFKESDWLSNAGFSERWKEVNRSKAYYFKILTGKKTTTDSTLEENLTRITTSLSWRVTKSLRAFLFNRGLLRHEHFPERINSNQAAAEQIIAIYESFWWMLTSIIRLPVAFYRAVLWYKLKQRSRKTR